MSAHDGQCIDPVPDYGQDINAIPTIEERRPEEELKKLRLELREVRSTSSARMAESELLVAALHEHIVELEKQRDTLKSWVKVSLFN